MLKKTITYTDYNGTERTEDFYFNLSKAELAEMELSVDGGMSKMIENISKTNDAPSVVKFFKEIILKSYGEKSEDGKRFKKSEELSESFSQTEAYSEMFMEFFTDTESAISFINNIIPDIEIPEEK